jgi:hypothetical protein
LPDSIPLYSLFEVSLQHPKELTNPFADVALNALFTSPSGADIPFLGFHDGDGQPGGPGNVWKQRFMPIEAGRMQAAAPSLITH